MILSVQRITPGMHVTAVIFSIFILGDLNFVLTITVLFSIKMDIKEYKNYHEDHMQNNSGTSFQECMILVLIIPFCTFVSSFVSSCSSKFITYIFEFGIVLLPTIFNCTVFSDISHIVLLNFVLFFALILFTRVDISILKRLLNSKVQVTRSSVTNYRASTNFVAVLCILAVDFTVFPKRLAKTESFGFGFMDLGVGFFVFSNGIVRKHIIKENQFPKLFKHALVLLLMGLFRVVSIKSIDYHEHVSEYGVHWNFFFTLAFCHLVSYFIMILAKDISPKWLALFIAVTHQLLLSLGLQEWVLSDIPRNSLLSANREGLASCLGYVSLYFAAIAVGKFIFKPEVQTNKKLLSKILHLCVLTWVGALISFKIFNVSRRLINIGYIFWVLGLSFTVLFLFISGEIILSAVIKKKNCFNAVPHIFECINANGLFFFLLGNLLTGLINTVCQTLLQGKFLSLLIILSYMVVLYSVTLFLYEKKIFLKL